MSRLIILFGAIWFCTITCKTEILQRDSEDPNYYYSSEYAIYNLDITEPVEFQIDKTNLFEPVERLIFNDSRISYIPHGIFIELPHLTTIEFIDCGMVEVRRSDFMNANNLITINLSHNNLTVLKDSIFKGANLVRHINLSHNKITLVSSGTFKDLFRLFELSLSFNEIKKLAPNVFTNLKALSYLDLRSNLIELTTADDPFTNMKLLDLDLSNNSIAAIDQQIFIKVKSIDFLHLDHNKLQKLIFNDDALNINKLFVADNNLTELHTNNKINVIVADNNQLSWTKIFIGNSVVAGLSLINNSLDNGIIDMMLMKNLHILDVGGNHLTQLPLDDFETLFPKLEKIGIYNNNWMCSDLREILKYFHKNEIHLYFNDFYMANSGPNIHGVQCNDEDTIKIPISDNRPSGTYHNNYVLEINQTRIQLATLQMENEQVKSDINRVRIILDNISDTTSFIDEAANANVLEICTGQITNLTEAYNAQLNSMSAQINMQSDQIQQINASLPEPGGYTDDVISKWMVIIKLIVALFAGYGLVSCLYKLRIA